MLSFLPREKPIFMGGGFTHRVYVYILVLRVVPKMNYKLTHFT
jgi:hypothetical protein